MNIAYQPYNSKRDQITETINGITLMLILYCLMLFTGQYSADKYTMNEIGKILVALQIGNLALNVILQAVLSYKSDGLCLRRWYQKCNPRAYRFVCKGFHCICKKKTQKDKALVSLHEAESEYHNHNEARFRLAQDGAVSIK